MSSSSCTVRHGLRVQASHDCCGFRLDLASHDLASFLGFFRGFLLHWRGRPCLLSHEERPFQLLVDEIAELFQLYRIARMMCLAEPSKLQSSRSSASFKTSACASCLQGCSKGSESLSLTPKFVGLILASSCKVWSFFSSSASVFSSSSRCNSGHGLKSRHLTSKIRSYSCSNSPEDLVRMPKPHQALCSLRLFKLIDVPSRRFGGVSIALGDILQLSCGRTADLRRQPHERFKRVILGM